MFRLHIVDRILELLVLFVEVVDLVAECVVAAVDFFE